MSKLLYVVAPDYSAFQRWVREQGSDSEEQVGYKFVRSLDDLRQRKRPEFMFLKGWRSRPDWRQIYNKALANGKRWWET